MKSLRRIHLYLGCVFAPALIFFAVSGAWQLFAFHVGTKDGSYLFADTLAKESYDVQISVVNCIGCDPAHFRDFPKTAYVLSAAPKI